MKNHTFVICAYRESPYLEECILSLEKQTNPSGMIMVTSTPNTMIQQMAQKHHIPLFVNTGEKGITQDWNFALSRVETKYATIAHQDDVYEPEYAEKIVSAMEQSRQPLISFSDYCELRNGEKVYDTAMLKIKRFMLFPLRGRLFQNSKFVRRRVLSLGDCICCPSVTFCLEEIERPLFAHGFRSCEDWEAWEKLSRQKGAFVYLKEPLMCHRIHEESATSEILRDHARVEENYRMYCKFWPRWFAKIINHFYTKSEDSNTLSKN
jgi:glycosyltransferase involved in cell wall biosynthesis